MIARFVLATFAWVLWTEESQIAPATIGLSAWRVVAGAETREDCELIGRHQVDGFPKIRKGDVAITPIGERAVIWAQATPPLTKLIIFRCLPEAIDPRPK